MFDTLGINKGWGKTVGLKIELIHKNKTDFRIIGYIISQVRLIAGIYQPYQHYDSKMIKFDTQNHQSNA